MIEVIGLCGRARAGKDTVAGILAARDGFTQASFAHTLKEAARVIFSLTDAQLYGDEKEIVDEYWGMSPREILQRMGTDAMRSEFGPNIWVNALRPRITSGSLGDHVVISDVRFDNEAEAILDMGGVLWEIVRPGTENAVRAHASEAGISGKYPRQTIHNNGSLGLLRFKIAGLRDAMLLPA